MNEIIAGMSFVVFDDFIIGMASENLKTSRPVGRRKKIDKL